MFMPSATRGDPEPRTGEAYPFVLLKHLLQDMMTQFAANGACLALLDENSGEMVIRLHMRTRNADPPPAYGARNPNEKSLLNRRTTIDLNAVSPSTGPLRRPTQQLEKIEIATIHNGDLFSICTSYAKGEDLIGIAWLHNEAYIMRHRSEERRV